MPEFWTADEDARLLELSSQGKPCSEIGKLMGKSEDSCRGRRSTIRNRASRGTVQPTPAVEEIKDAGRDGQIRMLQAQVAELQASQQPNRLPVENDAVPPLSVAELWKRAEADSIEKIAYTHERTKFRLKFNEGPVAFSFLSDQHIAPGTPVDFRRMREDAELIQATPNLYAILGGDGVDNHIKHRAAVLAARSQPHEQWELYEYYLSIFAEKIAVMISGNHDAWSNQIGGVDVAAMVAKKQGICYSPAEARMTVTVGKQEYKLAVRHQYRYNSSFNLGHTVKQWYRLGDEPFDIGCICHHHEPCVESFVAHGRKRYACRPGAYQITSAHSAQYGYNLTGPTCPTFILFPGEFRIIGFDDVRDAVKTLAAERVAA